MVTRAQSLGGSGDVQILPKKRKIAAVYGGTASKRLVPTVVISSPPRKRQIVPPQQPLNRLPSLTDPSRYLTEKGVLQTMAHLAKKVNNEVSITVYFGTFNSA